MERYLGKWLFSGVWLAVCAFGCTGSDVEPIQDVVEKEPEPRVTESAAVDNFPVAEDSLISIDEILPTIAAADAERFVGLEVFVVGTIAATGKSDTGHVFLNFGKDKDALVGFIHRSVVSEFSGPPDTIFAAKKVKIRGTVYLYNGQPNIRVQSLSHVALLPDEAVLVDLVSVEPPAPREVSDVVTVACFNLFNLFDTRDDPYRADEGTRSKPRKELDALAATIRGVNADVLALSEVENRGYLEHFNQALLRGLGYRHVVLFEGNDERGIDVALLSRLPVGTVTSHRHLTFPDGNGQRMSFRRDLLRVRIEPIDGLAFDVYCVHLKSKFGDDEGAAARLGEARMIRAVLDGVLEHDADARFLLCGDFNDDVTSPPLQAILGSGPRQLETFYQQLEEDSRVTYNKEPYRSMIDFVLASPAMAKRYVPNSYQIVPGSPAVSGSDHNIVHARFRIR